MFPVQIICNVFNFQCSVSVKYVNALQAEQDKASRDHQIRNLNEEISHQDDLINKLTKEKKHLQEVNQVIFCIML